MSMHQRLRSRTSLALLMGMVGWFVSTTVSAAATANAPTAVVTHSILADVVAKVAGSRVQLRVLVGPGGDAHTYEPTPGDAKALAEAALLFENGLGFETWLDKLYQSSGTHAQRVCASTGVKPRHANESESPESSAKDSDHHHHHHEDVDPHCWQDVHNVMIMTRNIAQALASYDPAGAAQYQANAQKYLRELEELDAWIVQQVAQVPVARRLLVTTHDSLGYFAQRYDFKVAATVLGSLTTEAADPSARQVAKVVQEIRRSGVPAVFTENMHNPQLMEQIAREAKVRFVTTLYTDALGEPDSPGASYVGMMRANVTAIVKALSPQ